MLVGYGSSGDDSDDEDQPVLTAAAAVAARAAAANAAEGEESSSDEAEDTKAEPDILLPPPGPQPEMQQQQQPPQMPSQKQPVPQPRQAPNAPEMAALPEVDWTGWQADPSSAPQRPAGPKLSSVAKRKTTGGGSNAQISSGFKKATTKHDEMVRAKAQELAEEADVRGRNCGLSSAYDSVFRASSAGDEAEPPRQRKVSKKEAKREKELETSLRS